MAEKAMLTLEGRQRDESGEETVTRLRTQADYSIRNGCHYILYEEKLPDSEAVVKNLIKLKGSVLEMTKRGPVSSRMVFEAGQSHRTDYVTPYGILPLEVCTQELEVCAGEPDGRPAGPGASGREPDGRPAGPGASGREPDGRPAGPESNFQENRLEIRLSYRLASGEQFLSHCAITISLALLRGTS